MQVFAALLAALFAWPAFAATFQIGLDPAAGSTCTEGQLVAALRAHGREAVPASGALEDGDLRASVGPIERGGWRLTVVDAGGAVRLSRPPDAPSPDCSPLAHD